LGGAVFRYRREPEQTDEMAQIKTDGDVWKVRLGQDRPRPGVRVVLFFCEPTGQRPYRVTEVSEERFTSQNDIESLSRGDLLELYRQSTSMDAPVLRSDEVADVRTRT
jgi:hypothetical protein